MAGMAHLYDILGCHATSSEENWIHPKSHAPWGWQIDQYRVPGYGCGSRRGYLGYLEGQATWWTRAPPDVAL